MENVLNPVKYIILPVHTKNDDDFVNDSIAYYMVFRCYLVCERKTYLNDGTTFISYDVVSPYNTFSTELNDEKIYPRYDMDGQCVKAKTVSHIFDTLDDALKIAFEENEKIYQSIICHNSLKNDNIEKYNNYCNRYLMLQNMFLEDTEYMLDNQKRVLKK